MNQQLRQEWRAMSQSIEEQSDIEWRVKRDAPAIIQRRERQKTRQLMKQWNRRVPINKYEERFRQQPPR